ncbi:prolyl oligopeptidase family serine peptidase [Streptomyces bauhiniae]
MQIVYGGRRCLTLRDAASDQLVLGPEECAAAYGHALLCDGRVVQLRHSARGGGSELWLLRPGGGAAACVCRFPGTVQTLVPAQDVPAVVVKARVMPGAKNFAEDAALRAERLAYGSRAVLHRGSRIYLRQECLGPDEPRLFLANLAEPASTDQTEPLDLTPWAGRSLRDQTFGVSADSRLVVTTIVEELPGPVLRQRLLLIDVATGERRYLDDEQSLAYDFHTPSFSPDGLSVLCVRSRRSTRALPAQHHLWLSELATGRGHELPCRQDLLPEQPTISRDGDVALFLADQHGYRRLFATGMADGTTRALTGPGAVTAYGQTSRTVLTITSNPVRPPALCKAGAETPQKADEPELVRVTAGLLGAWLALPPGRRIGTDRELPLLVWLHGGPISSWTGWLWGWNVPVFTEAGYAVLLPDPALSTGYGTDHVRRGWGRWDGAPAEDVLSLLDMALTTATVVDPDRCAVMGGSFGGYLALRLLETTDRFRCGVVQSAPHELGSFARTSDSGHYFKRELGAHLKEPAAATDLPATLPPVLLVHGALDRRVPESQALGLWQRLHEGGSPDDRGHRFLHLPDEGHSISRIGNLRAWYDVTTGFLDQHLNGAPYEPPPWL